MSTATPALTLRAGANSLHNSLVPASNSQHSCDSSDAAAADEASWNIEPELDVAADDDQLLAQVVRWYQRSLEQHREARAYLAARKLLAPELINHFQLGFAERRLARRLPAPQSKAGRLVRERLAAIGVLRTSGHAHYMGCLTLPVYAADGQLVDLYGLRIAKAFSPGTERHVRLLRTTAASKPSTAIFHLAGLSSGQPLVLTESPLSALALWQAGLRQVISLLPGETLDEELLHTLQQYCLPQVTLVLPNTPGGVAASQNARQQLTARGITAVEALLPAGDDALATLTRLGGDELLAIVERTDPARIGPVARHSAPTALPTTEVSTHHEQQETSENVDTQQTDDSTCVASRDVAITATRDEAAVVAHTASHPASAIPATPPRSDVSPPGDLLFTFDDRHYRVRGLAQNLSPERLKINLKASRDGLFHVNILDLYSAAQRRAFLRDASEELFVAEDLIKRDLGRLLEKLEAQQEQLIRARLAIESEPEVKLTEAERQEALQLLEDPQLIERILTDYERCGLVGEEANKQLCYLACVSRKLARPLAILVESPSAAGKTSLVDATLRFMPPDEQLRYSALTGQSLYYMGQRSVKHKILAIAEEEGVSQASYALKLLQSDGRLQIAAAGKDEITGRQQTQEYAVEGPVMLLLTTTAEKPDEELQNRCLVLRVSQSSAQTAAIHARQRAAYTLEGLEAAAQRERICRLQQNAQRLLEPYRVVIPQAERLTFRHDQTQLRREHEKYLTLIAASTLLYQYQRRRELDAQGQPYLVATLEDIALAHRLAAAALGQSLEELQPQTRTLLALLDDYVTQRCQREKLRRTQLRFTQRQLREALGWSDFALRQHLARLVQLEYVLAYRTPRGNQREYELVYDGQGRTGQPFVLGLASLEQLADV